MPRKPKFNTFLAIEMFKTGCSYIEIATELNVSESSIKMYIKRNAAELKENPLNRYDVVHLFKSGFNYKEIADKLNSNPDAVKKVIQRYAPELLKVSVDKDKVIELFKKGFNLKRIAVEASSTITNVRKILERTIPEEFKKRMKEKAAAKVNMKLFEPHEEKLNLKVVGALSVEDRKELMNERSWGINQNESLSDYSFFQSNRQSFVSDKKNNRRYRFDKRRGHIQKDLKTLNL